MKTFGILVTSLLAALALGLGGVAQAKDRHQGHRGNHNRHSDNRHSDHRGRHDSNHSRHYSDNRSHHDHKNKRHHDDNDYRGHRGYYRNYRPYYSNIGFGLYSYPYYGGYYDNGYYGHRYASVYRGRVVSGGGGDSIAVDVQAELARRGYYRGEIDGIIGSGTRRALRNFQAREGLRVTGLIDRATVDELDVG